MVAVLASQEARGDCEVTCNRGGRWPSWGWRVAQMPIVCRFLGMTIYLNYSDHAPPHFHVRYAGAEATVAIDPPAILRGHLPPRAAGLAIEWAIARRAELLADWELARRHEPLREIAPLE